MSETELQAVERRATRIIDLAQEGDILCATDTSIEVQRLAAELANAFLQHAKMVERSGHTRRLCGLCKQPMLTRMTLHETVAPYCVDCQPAIQAAVEKRETEGNQ